MPHFSSLFSLGRAVAAALLLGVLAACGGGADNAEDLGTQATGQSSDQADAQRRAALAAKSGKGGKGGKGSKVADPTPALLESDAFRFITQATFGPRPGDSDRLVTVGLQTWLDEQRAQPWKTLADQVRSEYAARQVLGSTEGPSRQELLHAFWRQALASDAQLRWRVGFALSQIFVFSSGGGIGTMDPIGSADYFDMLARHAFGNYRNLLEAVALHPAMGRYLSHLGNQKGDDTTGRVPDENFAREVMQLFSIGLQQLNADGTAKLGADGQPIPTYGPNDVAGLARVFTGWSWNCAEGLTRRCFSSGFNRLADIEVGTRPMVPFPDFHSAEEKRFLGKVVPAQAVADPSASLKVALDTLAAHPNVGPFIGRQLIQRLVTSNPSPAYVAAVAQTWANNGQGVRGDLAAVVRAILLHAEARQAGSGDGKLREPVLRLTALARAFPLRSLSGAFEPAMWDLPEYGLAQLPLRSPSVFNFYRPGYTPPGGQTAASGLVAPEMQIADETSVAGYLRFMRRTVESGFGTRNADGQFDMQLDLAAERALADDPAALVDRIFTRLLGSADQAALRPEVLDAVAGIKVPALDALASNQAAIDTARLQRVRAALLLTLAAPEFIVQQ